MKRLTRALAAADREIAAATISTTDLEQTLQDALRAAERCPQAYRSAPDKVRRQINQGFFVKLFVGEDGGI